MDQRYTSSEDTNSQASAPSSPSSYYDPYDPDNYLAILPDEPDFNPFQAQEDGMAFRQAVQDMQDVQRGDQEEYYVNSSDEETDMEGDPDAARRAVDRVENALRREPSHRSYSVQEVDHLPLVQEFYAHESFIATDDNILVFAQNRVEAMEARVAQIEMELRFSLNTLREQSSDIGALTMNTFRAREDRRIAQNREENMAAIITELRVMLNDEFIVRNGYEQETAQLRARLRDLEARLQEADNYSELLRQHIGRVEETAQGYMMEERKKHADEVARYEEGPVKRVRELEQENEELRKRLKREEDYSAHLNESRQELMSENYELNYVNNELRSQIQSETMLRQDAENSSNSYREYIERTSKSDIRRAKEERDRFKQLARDANETLVRTERVNEQLIARLDILESGFGTETNRRVVYRAYDVLYFGHLSLMNTLRQVEAFSNSLTADQFALIEEQGIGITATAEAIRFHMNHLHDMLSYAIEMYNWEIPRITSDVLDPTSLWNIDTESDSVPSIPLNDFMEDVSPNSSENEESDYVYDEEASLDTDDSVDDCSDDSISFYSVNGLLEMAEEFGDDAQPIGMDEEPTSIFQYALLRAHRQDQSAYNLLGDSSSEESDEDSAEGDSSSA